MRIALLLIPLAVFFAPASGPVAAQPRIVAVAEEIDRISERPLWPGFEPPTIPFEVLDRRRTWLVRHPHPPAEFVPVPARLRRSGQTLIVTATAGRPTTGSR